LLRVALGDALRTGHVILCMRSDRSWEGSASEMTYYCDGWGVKLYSLTHSWEGNVIRLSHT